MQKSFLILLTFLLLVGACLPSFAQTPEQTSPEQSQPIGEIEKPSAALELNDATADNLSGSPLALEPAEQSLTEDAPTPRPGSSGMFGHKPFWLSLGTGFLADRYWKDKLEFKTQQGLIKLQSEGTAYAIAGGVNIFSFLDFGVEYFKGPDYVVKGKKGDKFTYTMDDKKYTLSLDRDRKIKVLSYDVFSYGLQAGYTFRAVRFFAGLYQSTITAKTELEQVEKKQQTFQFLLPKLGFGVFIGNFFPYLVISLTDTVGVRYYF